MVTGVVGGGDEDGGGGVGGRSSQRGAHLFAPSQTAKNGRRGRDGGGDGGGRRGWTVTRWRRRVEDGTIPCSLRNILSFS
ncbi:hypothetical protein HanRHA438_Chr05g0238301 [Helianthus annuus]|nr:hypothetical protein HanRHA438_Chr05g0238301 [Helianthus annuus]